MPVLCNFIQIVGDTSQPIPETAGKAEVPGKTSRFQYRRTRGPAATALLVYSVMNLAGNAAVYINGDNVGTITATSGNEFFSTQLIALWAVYSMMGTMRLY